MQSKNAQVKFIPSEPAYFNRCNFNSHEPKMSHVGYLALSTSAVWFISYKLRLSHMGSDMGQIFPTAS